MWLEARASVPLHSTTPRESVTADENVHQVSFNAENRHHQLNTLSLHQSLSKVKQIKHCTASPLQRYLRYGLQNSAYQLGTFRHSALIVCHASPQISGLELISPPSSFLVGRRFSCPTRPITSQAYYSTFDIVLYLLPDIITAGPGLSLSVSHLQLTVPTDHQPALTGLALAIPSRRIAPYRPPEIALESFRH